MRNIIFSLLICVCLINPAQAADAVGMNVQYEAMPGVLRITVTRVNQDPTVPLHTLAVIKNDDIFQEFSLNELGSVSEVSKYVTVRTQPGDTLSVQLIYENDVVAEKTVVMSDGPPKPAASQLIQEEDTSSEVPSSTPQAPKGAFSSPQLMRKAGTFGYEDPGRRDVGYTMESEEVGRSDYGYTVEEHKRKNNGPYGYERLDRKPDAGSYGYEREDRSE